jgi:hypothetical protein
VFTIFYSTNTILIQGVKTSEWVQFEYVLFFTDSVLSVSLSVLIVCSERRSTLSAEFIFGELLSVSLSDDVVGSQESVSSVQICVFTIFYSTNTILIQGVKTSEWVQFEYVSINKIVTSLIEKRSKGDNAVAVDKQLRDVPFSVSAIKYRKHTYLFSLYWYSYSCLGWLRGRRFPDKGLFIIINCHCFRAQ